MSKQNLGIDFELKFDDIENINPSFTKAKVAIAYTGRNKNYCSISKEVFEKALPSLFYCPVIGRYDAEIDDFGSHDIRVVRDDEGNMRIENATTPYGVVYAETEPEWKLVTEEDGTQREYLFCDVILWKRQYGYERLIQQDSWHQSMEISVDSYIVDSDGYIVIESMTFEALCILGNSTTPCFESASLQLKSGEAINSYRKQFALMLQEIKESEEFKAMKFNFDNLEAGRRRGDLTLTEEKINLILEEFNLKKEDLAFEIHESMTEEDLRAKIEEVSAEPVNSFSITYKQKREALGNALEPIVVKDGDGEIISETYYWVMDFDDEYVYVERYFYSKDDQNTDYGRFKYSLTEEKGVVTATISGDFEVMILQWLTIEENENLKKSREALEALSQEFEDYKQEYVTKESEVNELRKFRKERLDADHRAAIDEVIAEFADLNENADFIALTKGGDVYKFEKPEDLRKELYAIRGKNVPVSFSKQGKKTNIKIPIADNNNETSGSPYGDLFSLYG